MLKKIIILLIILFILIHKHYFYHLIVSNIRLLIWIYKNNPNEIAKELKKTKDLGIQDFFFSKPIGISSYNVPFFDKQYLFRQENIKNIIDPNIFGKSDSLPHIINFFTTPFNFLGQWIGDSIFRKDYELRGKNNLLKEKYISAFTKDRIELYRPIIKNQINKTFILNKEFNLLEICTKLCNNLFYLLHFSENPDSKDFGDTNIFIEAVANFVTGDFLTPEVSKQIFNLKFYYQKVIKKIRNSKNKKCIVKDWLDAGINENDIFIEVIHNILGMVINWVNTIYPYLLAINKNEIPRIEKGTETEYILECFRYLMPVKFIASKIKEPNVINKNKGYFNAIHDLTLAAYSKSWGSDSKKFNLGRMADHKNYMSGDISKCPFYNTKLKAKVPCNLKIFEKENYTPFGSGYRRCPGEIISMVFLEEVAFYIKDKNIKIYLKDGKSIIKNHIFDKKESNYNIIIN